MNWVSGKQWLVIIRCGPPTLTMWIRGSYLCREFSMIWERHEHRNRDPQSPTVKDNRTSICPDINTETAAAHRKMFLLQNVFTADAGASLVIRGIKNCLQCGRCRRHTRDTWVGKTPSPEGGNSNPLLYPCLGNPMDRGAWWATDHEVTKSWTRLSS